MTLLDPATLKRVQEWLIADYDEKNKAEIQELMKNNPQELIDAFYTDLSFGTGGLRGLMGIGTNRMNQYTVRKATQGLANYIKQQKIDNPSVVIGFDSRNNSHFFANVAAQVLAANGIKVHLLKEMRPVPYVSFSCRHLHCTAAVMITASHNPPEYNGYKVYWSDGAQIVPPQDTGIMQEVEAIHNPFIIHTAKLEDPLIETVDELLDDDYLEAINPLQHFPEQNRQFGKDLKIVYSSLHGTGITLMPKALLEWGFTTLHLVPKQCDPDGNFPTVKFPNPEYPETLKLGIEELVKTQSDILIVTDPDADRFGVAVMHKGQPVLLTGNDTAAICVYFLCETLKSQGKLPAKGAFVTTIVSTELLKTIASAYNLPCFEVLTGFKYIGEMIRLWENDPNGYQFIFGAEESYGSLIGTHARDKDSIVSSCLISEIALWAKKQNLTLVDILHKIYRTFGIFREKQFSLNFNPGKEGMEQIATLMSHLRSNPPQQIMGLAVKILEDYQNRTRLNLETKQKESLTLPKSNVLLFRLADGSKLVIRPSGTEPKLKIYASVTQKTFASIEEAIAQCDAKLDQLIASLEDDLKGPKKHAI